MADRAQVLISQAFKKEPKFICDECGYSTNIKSRQNIKYSSKCTEYQIYKIQSLPKPLTLYPIFDTISDNYQCKKIGTTLKLTLYPI